MSKLPYIITGGSHTDSRGRLLFFNDFDMSDIKRFYQITSHQSQITNHQSPVTNHQTVRAWQGHKIEEKYFYVSRGKFLICLVKIDDWRNPSRDLPVTKYILKAASPQILHVPAGFANGIKALESDSILIVFSNLSLNESQKDDYRFDANLWFDWNKA
jgi:dTDP-4-dehydrorhamnose 3,5-epimerase-like enzyme